MNILKQKKRVLSLFLAFVLMLTYVLPVGASAATSHEDFIRVFHLDAGRKYFTVDQVTEIIDALSASGYTHMELAIGNGGLRLLLDDMSVTVGSTTYSGDKVAAGIKAGNVSFAHAGEWSQSEMDSIISYAASRNIGIIPLVNSPGHMSAILDAAEYVGISSPAYSAKISSGWWGSTSTKTSSTTVSLSNATAVAFTQALVKKYVDYFAARGCEYFNIGADEYAADVHSSGSMGFGYMQSKGWYGDFVNYINDVAAMIKSAGMKPIAFNDGIYFNENDDTAFDKDIIIAYWIPAWGTYYVASPAYLVSKGHKILNTNDDWYYVIGRTSEGYGYDNAYNGVNNTPVTKVADGSTMALSNLVGSMNCVWCDEPNASYESNKSNVMYFIARLAEKNPDYFVVNTHEHTYETVTVEATCTENGSVTTTCTGCGESTVEVLEALGHSYECTETPATCAEAGSKVYTCASCGDSYSETVPATGNHSYQSVTVDPTCVEDGSVTYTCVVCGTGYAESIPATGEHIYRSETVSAGCTESGCITYTCALCGDTYTEEIPASGHSYTCVVTEATCTEEGSKVSTCASCGHTFTEEIPATGHNYVGVVTDATCTEGGFTTYTCDRCGDSYAADHTDPKGHSYTAAVVDATCTTDGSVTYYCSCGDHYSEVIPSTGHSYQSVVTVPSCTAEGYTTCTCTSCGDSYITDRTNALGHSNETVVVAPTCTTGGYTSSTCSVCGEGSIYNETAALGHDFDSVTVDPTETEDGYTTHTCKVCGYSYTDNYVDALGHTITSVVTAPTCTEQGYTTHTCTTCGEVTVDSYVPALGHSYQKTTVDATCTADGSVSAVCSACGDAYTEVISAYGHNYSATVTAPTCTVGGHTVYSCDRCGDNYVGDYTEATGHHYTGITTDVTCTQDGYTTYLCSGCGDSYIGETVTAVGHSYQSVTNEATCTENGSVTYVCSACGDTYTEEILSTGHDYRPAVTEATCTENGFTTHTCSKCGDSYRDAETEALGHSYSTEEVNGNLVHTCDRCGDTYTESLGWVALTGKYVLDTDGIETGAENKYIVVGSGKDYALTYANNTVGASAVTVSNNAVVLENASAYEFYFVSNSGESGSYLLTKDGSNGIYHMGGGLYYGRDNKGYWHIGSASNGSYQLYDYDNRNWYLNYGYVWASDAVNRFAVSSNARSVRLFKATEGYVRLAGGLTQTWPHGAQATADAVVSSLQIQTSADGVNTESTLAVTADMIAWDKTFDGYTAGTYTGTVSYQGVEIGTVTVTVTGEHVYESETVSATCTEEGFTVHTCAECGLSYTDGHTAALGHAYASVESNGYMVYTCQRCGDSYSEKIASVYSKVSVFTSGKSHVITLVSGNKYYALSHKNNTLSAVQVTVSNNQITSEITEDLLWTYSGNKLSYVSNGTTYYLYAQSQNSWWGGWWGSTPTLTVSTSSSTTVSLTGSKVKVGSYYLRYSSQKISLSSSGTTANLFVEE